MTYTRINSQTRVTRQSPTGSTAKAKVENAQQDVLYAWSDYNSAGYSPTSASGNWSYRMLRCGNVGNGYVTFEAFKEGGYWTFNYNGNAWVQH